MHALGEREGKKERRLRQVQGDVIEAGQARRRLARKSAGPFSDTSRPLFFFFFFEILKGDRVLLVVSFFSLFGGHWAFRTSLGKPSMLGVEA